MEHDIVHCAKNRHTVKAYDSSKKISQENVEKIKELLRFSASSTNAQPWHFILASTQEGKEKIARSTEGVYAFNKAAILNASHIVVFCSKLDINEDYLLRILEQEEKDGRFVGNPELFKKQMHAGRSMFVSLYKKDSKDLQHWMEKQVYLNLGVFLLGVAALGIEATAMEGIDVHVLDEEFELHAKGYKSLALVALGYHDPEKDYNVKLPKSRLPYSEILTEI